jgi:tellurite resistance protein TerC
MNRFRRMWAKTAINQWPIVRKVAVAVIGTTILLIGLALIVLPGPAFIVIPIGLGILATEFVWARRAIRRGRIFVKKVHRSVTE